MAIQSSYFRAETDKGRGSSAVLIREMNMVVNDLEALEAANAGFVDLTTDQTVDGEKTWSDAAVFSSTIDVDSNATFGANVEITDDLDVSGRLFVSGGSGTVSAGAVTVNAPMGKITTGTLTNAAGASITFTLNSASLTSSSVVTISEGEYSGTLATNGYPRVFRGTPGTGSMVFTIVNTHPSNALNGTLVIHYHIIN